MTVSLKEHRSTLAGGAAHRLQNVREIASLINAGSDLATILDRIVFAVCQHTQWTTSGIMAVNRQSGYSELVTRFDPELSSDASLATQWSLATSPSLRVAETKRPLVIEDAQSADEFPGYRKDALARGYHTVAMLPLGSTNAQGHEMVFAVHARARLKVSDEELDFLSTITHLAAIAVDKAKSLHAERMLTARLQRTLEVNSSLLERVLAGGSMQIIAGMIETILPDPLIIIDLTADSFHVSRSPEPDRIGDREWREAVRRHAVRALVAIVQESEPSDFRQTRRIDLTGLDIPVDRQAYVEPLQVDGETVGGLIIFPRQRGLDDLDFLIAQEAKFALSAQLMRGHTQFRTQASAHADLLDRLFEGAWGDSQRIRGRASRLGIDLSVPALLMAVDVGQSVPDGRRERSSHLHRTLDRAVRRVHPGAAVIEHQTAFFVYLPEGRQPFEKVVGLLGRRITDAVRWEAGHRPAMALASVCRRPEDYPVARDQCMRVLTLARMFNRTGLVKQGDFGPFALLLSALDNAVVRSFITETLGSIEAYDREHDTGLIKTAKTFIDRGCRYQATSEALGIHVSTLRYRLKRLLDVFGIDLENAETRFALALALRLRSMQETTDTSGLPDGRDG